MLDSFVDDLIHKAKRTPYRHLEGYMKRWWLNIPAGFHEGGARIHLILRSDNDRHFHDHPWDYTTIILRGWYVEKTKDGELECPTGSILHRTADHAHKLILPDGPVWTLFIFGPYKQGWGFITDNGKVPWCEYLGATDRGY